MTAHTEDSDRRGRRVDTEAALAAMLALCRSLNAGDFDSATRAKRALQEEGFSILWRPRPPRYGAT